MKTQLAASLVLMSLLLLLTIHTRAEVITLTADTFSDKVKEKDTAWFVKFCVPWCKHCKKLGSLWEDFGKAVESEDEIEVGEVDCSTSKPTKLKKQQERHILAVIKSCDKLRCGTCAETHFTGCWYMRLCTSSNFSVAGGTVVYFWHCENQLQLMNGGAVYS
ncbi:hypothetical protein ACLB2K_029778 [Fragaria x ananassa]